VVIFIRQKFRRLWNNFDDLRQPPLQNKLLIKNTFRFLVIFNSKVIFKEHLIQGLSEKRIFTEVAKLNVIAHLPEVFSPKCLQTALGISNGFAYNLVRTPGFPAVFDRNRIIVSKEGLIRWIEKNEINK